MQLVVGWTHRPLSLSPSQDNGQTCIYNGASDLVCSPLPSMVSEQPDVPSVLVCVLQKAMVRHKASSLLLLGVVAPFALGKNDANASQSAAAAAAAQDANKQVGLMFGGREGSTVCRRTAGIESA